MAEFQMYDIAFDLDGVLHPYSKGYQGPELYDPVHPDTVDTLNTLRASGFTMIVCTARDPLDNARKWLDENGLGWLEVTNQKPVALIYPDDRGYRFTGDWNQFLMVLPQLIAKTLMKEKLA